jgi:hypothetical protein
MIDRDVKDSGRAAAVADLTPEQESALAPGRHGT